MITIKVIEFEKYRDGGTVVYRDHLNRLYYTYISLRPKVFNDMPFVRGMLPPPWVQEIPVQLDIVTSESELQGGAEL